MVSVANKQILIDLQQYDEDFTFLNDSLDTLRKKYSNSYVVIWNKQVVSSAGSITEAIDLAKQQGIPTEKAMIEFISKKEEILIL